MERFSNNVDGMMISDPDGHWVQFHEINGTAEEVKQWLYRWAVHASYPGCQIRKTKECTCGLTKLLTK